MARQFTRSEFHDLVWSRPMTHLAKDFALSDVALHKICRKHAIPTPPLGWWAKQQAGKAVVRTPLPPVEGAADRVVIATPELRGETPAVAAAREAARVRASDEAPSDGSGADAIVERTIAGLRRGEPSHKGLVATDGRDVVACEVAPASVDRLETILCRLVAAAAHQGFRLKAGDRRARFAGDGETISLAVTEEVRRVKHALTPKEQKLEDAWVRKSERRQRGRSWDWEWEPRPSFPEWDWVCTGRLGLELERVNVMQGQGPRGTFRDARVQRLDAMAGDAAVALAVLATAKREERERRAGAERVRLEERRERERPLRERHVHERRREGLDAVLADLAALERLRELHDRLSRLSSDECPGRVTEFLRWAAGDLAAREAAFAPDGLERRFAEARLFGKDDDFSFKSPYWY
jgi:hypothetical protein